MVNLDILENMNILKRNFSILSLSAEAGRDFALLKGSPESCKIQKDFSWLWSKVHFTLTGLLQGVSQLYLFFSPLFKSSNHLGGVLTSERIEEHWKFLVWDKSWCHGGNISVLRPACQCPTCPKIVWARICGLLYLYLFLGNIMWSLKNKDRKQEKWLMICNLNNL